MAGMCLPKVHVLEAASPSLFVDSIWKLGHWEVAMVQKGHEGGGHGGISGFIRRGRDVPHSSSTWYCWPYYSPSEVLAGDHSYLEILEQRKSSSVGGGLSLPPSV